LKQDLPDEAISWIKKTLALPFYRPKPEVAASSKFIRMSASPASSEQGQSAYQEYLYRGPLVCQVHSYHEASSEGLVLQNFVYKIPVERINRQRLATTLGCKIQDIRSDFIYFSAQSLDDSVAKRDYPPRKKGEKAQSGQALLRPHELLSKDLPFKTRTAFSATFPIAGRAVVLTNEIVGKPIPLDGQQISIHSLVPNRGEYQTAFSSNNLGLGFYNDEQSRAVIYNFRLEKPTIKGNPPQSLLQAARESENQWITGIILLFNAIDIVRLQLALQEVSIETALHNTSLAEILLQILGMK
jgi:hypothetical protein